MVELLVALVFMGVLMSGLAAVFKSSLGTFTGSRDSIASLRKNRMTLDLLYDDLNSAGMYLAQVSTYPGEVTGDNEPFRVEPDVFENKEASDPLKAKSDALYLYYDEPLPFEAKVTSSEVLSQLSWVDSRAQGKDTIAVALDCGTEANANLFKKVIDDAAGASPTTNPKVLFRSGFETLPIKLSSASVLGSVIGFELEVNKGKDWNPMTGATGTKDIIETERFVGDPVMFLNQGQNFCYRISEENLDPGDAAKKTPCLVRLQGNYDGGSFKYSQKVVLVEDVSRFKVYLSADFGKTWVGLDGTLPADWAAIKTGLNGQLSKTGRDGVSNVNASYHWFRDIPVMVRVDLTMRSSTKRTEYAKSLDGQKKPIASYQERTQSLVILPRHFGNPY